MENQIILAVRSNGSKVVGYFSIWTKGKRIAGSFKPSMAIGNIDWEPYQNEELDQYDIPVMLECLLKWS